MRSELLLATRGLVRRPLLSGAVILTIGLAIAATTMAYSVVDGVLLEPLPYAEPDRLVTIWETAPDRSSDRNVTSPANVIAWRENLRSVTRIAALAEMSATLTGDGEPEQIGAMLASAEYFQLVGAEPLIGRLYTPEEDVRGAPAGVVLSEGLWQRRYGGDPTVIGRVVRINGASQPIIGVLPDRFDFTPRYGWGLGRRDAWLPHQWDASAREWGGRYLQVIAGLAPGATVAQLQQEASALAARLAQEHPERMAGWGVRVIGLHTEMVGDVRTTVWVVFGAVCFVLAIACANVANLLLTRAGERQQEMAVRAALGAGQRLYRQLLVEGALLSVAGGTLGILLAKAGVSALIRSAPDLPRLNEVGLDGSVVGFAALATALTAVVFGLVPALHLTGRDLATWLTQRVASSGVSARRFRAVLVGLQLTLSFVLLVGAGLLVRSLVNRVGVGVGVELDQVLTAEVTLPGERYATGAARADFIEQAVDRMQRLAGVRQGSAGSIVPMSGQGQGTGFVPRDRPEPPPGQEPDAAVRWVHRDYHRTLGIPLLEGRLLSTADRADAPTSVLINAAGARRVWPGESAVGKRITMEWGRTLEAEIVGVVGDVRLEGPDDAADRTTLYWDHRQAPLAAKTVLIARTEGDPEALAPALRALVRELDANLPLFNVRTMRSYFAQAIARARFTTAALASFALLALLLAALGLYGVMAYVTQQREREIGIRIALGADRRTVLGLVLRQGLAVVLPALAVGLATALAATRLLRSLVFGVGPLDPLTFAAVALLLLATAVLACWVPARRAASVDPVLAMRAD